MDRIKSICIEEELCQSHDGSLEQILKQMLSYKKTPNEINTVFGYRTPMSTKNKDTWEFAHKYFGKIWYISGLITLPTSIILMFFVIGKGTELVGTAGAIIMGVQLVPMLGSIFPTEIALRKNFDKNGERK